MFKPGDSALVVKTQKVTTVMDVPMSGTSIETADGTFDEAELLQAHPTVLATARAESYETRVRAQSQNLLARAGHKTEVIEDDKKAKPKLSAFQVGQKISKVLKKRKLKLDLRGHWKNSKEVQETVARDLDLISLGLGGKVSVEDLEELLRALKAKKTLNKWVTIARLMGFYDGCSYCGSRNFLLETDGATIRLSGGECSLPNGFEPNEWELNVPSGKIVVSNDLRQWFPLPEGDGDIPSINTTRGCRAMAQAYAAIGMSHGFVGNTCPGVYKLGGDSFKIASEPYEDYWDEEKKEYLPRKDLSPFVGERVASVCTDLWWYSLCDNDEFERRRAKFGGKLDSNWDSIIDVKPGVYRFRHYDDVNRDGGNEVVYSTFEWVRDPDPVRDFLQELDQKDVNPHAYVQSQTQRWPTLYGTANSLDDEPGLPWAKMSEEQRHHAWQRVADHIFFTIGGGTDWHEKGFPTAKVDPTVLDIEPPEFRGQYHWYPFAKGYGGVFSGVKLSPAFAKLAFRCLESVISFGMSVNEGQRCREVKQVRERMLLAAQKYREMAKEYPGIADPAYIWWLSQPGRVEAWVERFDLGPKYLPKHQENVAAQRWVPEDAYAIEFDARKLNEGHFTGKNGCWAEKKDAAGFALLEWAENGQEDPEDNCYWSSNAGKTAIPLYSVARVLKVGQVSHTGNTLIELGFDYGNKWMMSTKSRKAVEEFAHKNAIRVLTKEEYEQLLPEAEKFYSQKSQKKTRK